MEFYENFENFTSHASYPGNFAIEFATEKLEKILEKGDIEEIGELLEKQSIFKGMKEDLESGKNNKIINQLLFLNEHSEKFLEPEKWIKFKNFESIDEAKPFLKFTFLVIKAMNIYLFSNEEIKPVSEKLH